MYSRLHSPHQINMSIRAHFNFDATRHSEFVSSYFSGGADDTVLKYDLTRYTTNRLEGDGPTQAYTQHSVSVVVGH